MRQFDNRNSWLDNEGKPLIGRISFYKKDTSEYETITDVDGTSLSNPILTNTLGQTVVQVFLQDNKDYTINFEKYIGNGDYTQDEEITNWEFQYSCDNLYDVYGIEVNCDGVQAVNTINDLQNFDPALVANERNYIQVLGYNELGDCEPVYYIWNANSVAFTNGGSIIASNVSDTGRWELVDTFIEVFDVRHFGVFGAQTRQLAEDAMGAQIVLAQQYANSIGKTLYFPAIDNDVTWYNFQTVQSISKAKFDSNVYIFDEMNQTHYITCTDDSDYNVYGNAVFHIIASTVRTKWGKDGTHVIYEPSDVLYIDTTVATSNKTISNVIVKASRFVEGWTFDNCIFELIEKIYNNCIFRNCKLTESMFSKNVDLATITVYDNDTILLSDWPTTSKWLVLRQQNTQGPLDFEGRTLDNTCEVNWSSTDYIQEYRNVVFNNFLIKQPKIKLVNCNGNVNISNSITDMNIDNVNLIFNMLGNILPGTFYTNRSTISFGKNITFGNFYSDFSTINDISYTYTASEIIIDFSIINVGFSTTGHTDIRNSTMNGNVITGNTNFIFENDVFNAQHEIPIIIADTLISGSWIKNVGNISNPIYFNISGSGTLAANESSHNYQYIDNMGTFLPVTGKSVIYKDGSNIMNTHSGSYELVDFGKIQFYIKNNKDIIISQPYVESKNIDIFHIGSIVNYKITMEFIINYSTFSGSTLPMSFVQIKEFTGNIPNDNWVNGYIYMPIIGRLDNNDPTVVNCKIYLKIEKQ